MLNKYIDLNARLNHCMTLFQKKKNRSKKILSVPILAKKKKRERERLNVNITNIITTKGKA